MSAAEALGPLSAPATPAPGAGSGPPLGGEESSAHEKLALALEVTRIRFSAERPEKTPFEGCLADLLDAVAWSGTATQLIEAMPHVDPIESLDTLAIVLRRLGYDVEIQRRRRSALTEEDFPAAFRVGRELQVARDLAEYQARAPRSDPTPLGALLCTVKARHREARRAQTRSTSFFGETLERNADTILGLAFLTAAANCFALATPLYAMSVYNLALPAEALWSLVFFTLIALSALAAETYLKHLRGELIATAAIGIHARVMREGVLKALNRPLDRLERVATNDQLAQLRRMENLLGFFQSGNANALIDAPFVVIFLLVIGLWGGWLVVVPIVAILAFMVLGAIASPVESMTSVRSEGPRRTARGLVRETVVNADAIRHAGVEGLWLQRLARSLDEDSSNSAVIDETSATIADLGQLIVGLAGACTLAVGAVLVIEAELSIGAVIAATLLNSRILGPAQALVQASGQLRDLRSDVAMIEKVLAYEENETSIGAPRLQRRLSGSLSVRRVGYRLPEAPDFALRNLSFELRPGERLALVGPTGSGKSLLMKVATGLVKPTLGTISINGLPISQMASEERRSVFGHAPSRPSFFYGTLGQNMRFARADISDFEIEELLDALDIPLEPSRFPEGLATRLTEQRRTQLGRSVLQKLNVARAILSNRPILVFGDIFPDLDPICYRSIFGRLNHSRSEQSVILISSQRNVVTQCDTTLALDHGAMVAYGPTPEVLDAITKS